MNKPPLQFEVLEDFKGQYSDTEPHGCPPGTMFRQFNMLTISNACITTRGGVKEITLDTLE